MSPMWFVSPGRLTAPAYRCVELRVDLPYGHGSGNHGNHDHGEADVYKRQSLTYCVLPFLPGDGLKILAAEWLSGRLRPHVEEMLTR